jgi:16S rRNA (cytidine1402-2'-O)-methyltransferase
MNAMPGRLYVVATPLGNLEDLSARALRVLRDVDLIACEDTRRAGRLLRSHQVATPTTSYFEHNARLKAERILERLRQGAQVALVSDAGTPTISDPGFRLVRWARREGIDVVPVPGPNAAIAALSVSGLPTDRFRFLGFLPSRAGARRRALEELAEDPDTLVFHESALRIVDALADMRQILGDRPAFLCREATKLHEEYRSGSLGELRAELASRSSVRGELTLVVAGAPPREPAAQERVPELFAQLTRAGRTRREAVKEIARRLRLPSREVYRVVLPEED